MSDSLSASDSEGDVTSSISQTFLKVFDSAFDQAIREARGESPDGGEERPSKRRRVTRQPAGGFVIDEDTVAGGFIPKKDVDIPTSGDEEDIEVLHRPSHIPISIIPRALQILDLDPSDSAVLDVFANAAVDLSEDDALAWSRDDEGKPEEVVSRRDFRAVCVALVPDVARGDEGEEDEDTVSRTGLGRNSESPSTDLNDFDESGTSEDEYIPESSKKSSRVKGKGKSVAHARKPETRTKSQSTIAKEDRSESRSLTDRQEQNTLTAFSLFFPETRGKELDERALAKRSLTIKDIAHAASLIKEKITAEEMVEMLSYFSKSPNVHVNPTMSFKEFQEMMITAKLA